MWRELVRLARQSFTPNAAATKLGDDPATRLKTFKESRSPVSPRTTRCTYDGQEHEAVWLAGLLRAIVSPASLTRLLSTATQVVFMTMLHPYAQLMRCFF
jgi:hypothetical protein